MSTPGTCHFSDNQDALGTRQGEGNILEGSKGEHRPRTRNWLMGSGWKPAADRTELAPGANIAYGPPSVPGVISGTPEITHTRGRGQLHGFTYFATLTPRAGKDLVPSLGAQG